MQSSSLLAPRLWYESKEKEHSNGGGKTAAWP
jgi:hypothetical protein